MGNRYGCCRLCDRPDRRSTYTGGGTLELYRSLPDLGAMVRVEDECNRRGSRSAGDDWLERYYPREVAIKARLERQYEPAAMEGADEISVHPRCGKTGRPRFWRVRYEAVLNALEQRLGLSSPK